MNLIADLTHSQAFYDALNERRYYLAHAICLLIALTSSALNPILYGWCHTKIRIAIRELYFDMREKSGNMFCSMQSTETDKLSNDKVKRYDSVQSSIHNSRTSK